MRNLKLNAVILSIAMTATMQAWAADTSLNGLFNLQQDCQTRNDSVAAMSTVLSCGSVHGAVKSAYYSLNNGYFVNNLNQDTAVIGGYIKYETAPFYGVQAAVGYDIQRRLDEKNKNDEVSELKEDRDGLAEAYLTWKNDLARVTVGNQRLNLPFMGDYADRRVLMFLYQASDVQIGNQYDFLRLTKVNKYKSYAEDEFTKSSRQNSKVETDGVWSIGVGKRFELDTNKSLKTQLWYQDYDDYLRLIYTQADLRFSQLKYAPEFSLQYMSGKDQSKAFAGEINSQIWGVQAAFKVLPTASLKVAYNYIKPDQNSYLNGALLMPYASQTSSGEIFAQPFFTSTQDLGAGNALMLSLEGKISDQVIAGARYSYMDLKEAESVASRNQSEYMLFGIYNFTGALKGFSVSNFAGIQTSPRYDKNFLQNRFALSYKF
ncbi:OprD family porin [Acinetobacter sp. Tr-809]|uniref:OprD family porin n=1 Tax=Acinetobacter sp. Tr-809 TaxID=2608324 RepID=UPI0014245D6D|nr:OprD family porin [Acinetobacter sp. Tr-809]NIE98308.1 OprD family porin [Acinetobacter sp. Tr-809]